MGIMKFWSIPATARAGRRGCKPIPVLSGDAMPEMPRRAWAAVRIPKNITIARFPRVSA